jgi:hypothetical protein
MGMTNSKSKSKSKLLYDWRFTAEVKVIVMLQLTVSLSLNKAPICGLRPDFYYCQTVAGLLMSGALSDEKTGLSFARVAAVISLLSVCTISILLLFLNYEETQIAEFETLMAVWRLVLSGM